MPTSRIPSPARSQGVVSTPRKHTPRRSRSVCSATSNKSTRLTALISDTFKLSPMPNRRSVLNDNTDIEIPGRKSWWKNLGENSTDVMEVLSMKDVAEVNNVADEFDVEILSQEKKNYTIDFPESSDGESISSIVIPQRKLFTQNNPTQKKFGNLIKNRETLTKLQKTYFEEKDIDIAPKNLFNQAQKPKKKSVFPAILLNTSPKANKTKELPSTEVEGQVRSLFGNRPVAKRKNIYADFIVSETEAEIPEIQPKVFGFNKNKQKENLHHSPTSSIDLEMDEWMLLPSSTMVGSQLEEATTPKRAKLSKLSEANGPQSDPDKTKQANKSKTLTKSTLNVSEKVDNSINNQSNVRLTRNKSKSLRENSIREENSKVNKSKNTSKSKRNDEKKSLAPDGDKVVAENDIVRQNNENLEVIGEQNLDEDEDFPLEYDDEQMDEAHDNNIKTNNALCIVNSVVTSVCNQANNNRIEAKNKSLQANEVELSDKNSEVTRGKENNNEDVEKDIITKNQEIQTKQQTQNRSSIKENKSLNSSVTKLNVTNNKSKVKHSIEFTNNDVTQSSDKLVKENEVNNKRHNEKTEEQIVEKDSMNVIENASNVGDKQNKNGQKNYEIMANKSKQDIEIQNTNQTKDGKKSRTMEQNESENQVQNEVNNEKEGQENEIDNNEQSMNEIDIQEKNITEQESVIDDEVQNESENDDKEIESEVQDESENEEQNETSEDAVESEVQNESKSENEEENESENEVENESENEEENESENEVENESENEEENESENEDRENDKTDSKVRSESENEQNESEEIENEIEEQNIESENEDNETNEDNESSHQMENSEQMDIDRDESKSDDQNESMEVDQNNENVQNEDNEAEKSNHDTTGRHRHKPSIKSPEAILHDKTNQIESFTVHGRNTSVRKTKSIIKHINIRPSLAPVRESTGMSDSNYSGEGSGWDSHRTTRKTIRQTLGKDFTPRKSLRALVMEKSAKRHTNFDTTKFDKVQANSTELPVDYHESFNEEPHEISARTRQTTLETYLMKIKQDNLERRRKTEEEVRNSLKVPMDAWSAFKVPSKPVRKFKPVQVKPKPRQKPSIALDMLPSELIEDMKYKPPKRFRPSNASWITKRLYKFLEGKLEPKYDYKARVRAEKLVELLYAFSREIKRGYSETAIDELKREMARLDVVHTHFDFYQFFRDYMPREIRVKVVPDIVNEIPLPKHGIFSNIL